LVIVGRGMGLVVFGQAVGEDFAVFSGVGFKGDIAFYASVESVAGGTAPGSVCSGINYGLGVARREIALIRRVCIAWLIRRGCRCRARRAM